jgi:quercetin dioxygenase-like cupin family protein
MPWVASCSRRRQAIRRGLTPWPGPAKIYNPRQNDRVVFLQTARETDGQLLRLEMFASPGAAAPPDHVHPRQEERFETVSGVLRARVGGEERSLGAGETMVVPPGTPHTWWIDGQEDVHVLVEFRPALNTETFFETMYGLARDGKVGENGVPPFLQTAVISSAYEIYLPRPPIAMQKALFALLVPVGKLMGYRPTYPEYSGTDAPETVGPGDGSRRAGILAAVGAGLLAFALVRRRAGRR